LYYGANYYYYNRYGDAMSNQKVGVFVEIENKKEHSLGIPLPKGTVRVYKADKEGSLQFVGEDSIDHSPKDEKVRIKLGDAFDVVGSRKQTDWKKMPMTPMKRIQISSEQGDDGEGCGTHPMTDRSAHPMSTRSRRSLRVNIPVPRTRK
jgi:hypothetical protein